MRGQEPLKREESPRKSPEILTHKSTALLHVEGVCLQGPMRQDRPMMCQRADRKMTPCGGREWIQRATMHRDFCLSLVWLCSFTWVVTRKRSEGDVQ